MAEGILERLQGMVENSRKKNFQEYFPTMLEDLDYIWNGLVEDMECLTKEELVHSNASIHKLVIQYFARFIQIYSKEVLGIEVKYSFDDIRVLGGCAAYNEKSDEILVSVIGMMIQAENTSSYIQPIFHEFQHKLQHQSYQKETVEELLPYPAHFILTAKHYSYAKEVDKEGEFFYYDNYNRLYSEVDAEESSLKWLENCLPGLYSVYKKENMESIELEEKVQKLQELILEDLEEIKEDLTKRNRICGVSSHELYTPYLITSVFLQSQKEKDSLILVDRYLKDHPELQEVYPILKVLWKDGKPKMYHELIKEKRELLEKYTDQELTVFGKRETYRNQIHRFYDTIVKSDPVLILSKWILQEDLLGIQRFLKSHPTFLEEYPEEIEEVLKLYGGEEGIKELLTKEKQKVKEKK